MSVTVSHLYSYPVKSCAGLAHRASPILSSGLPFDRRWVIVDKDGVFMTQRTVARMALIQPGLDTGQLTLDAPGMPALHVPRAPDDRTPVAVAVRIWRSDTLAADEGAEASAWLSAFLGQPCRLLREHPDAARLASPEHVNRWIEKNADWAPGFPAQHAFAFADSFPFLIASQTSLDELNEQLRAKRQRPVPMNRFRPNIVLQGLDAYEEDYLTGLRINGMTFAFVKRCARCPIPNIDQATAVSADEPGLTLAAHRTFPEGVLFGVNAVIATSAVAAIDIGDVATPEYDI